MSVIELDPHCSGYPEHDHESEGHEEVYVVLRGSIVLETEGAERVLTQGTFVRVAPETKRKFVTRAEGATKKKVGKKKKLKIGGKKKGADGGTPVEPFEGGTPVDPFA